MTKYVITLFVILPFLSIAQELTMKKTKPKPYNTSIGITPGYSGYSGLIGEVNLQQRIYKNNFLRVSAYSDFFINRSFTLGWRKELFSYKRLTFNSGLDLKYSIYDYSSLGHESKNFTDLSLILPLSIDLKLSKRFTLTTSFGLDLKSLVNKGSSISPMIGPHIGISFRF